MGKIHMLPTSLPSRLGYLTKKGKEVFKDLRFFDRFMPTIMDGENQNIYITNDEEIKEGDWTINTKGANEIYKVASFNGGVPLDKNGNGGLFTKKIILTTDQDLIADGVQAIDDEFLEWFVNNSSCEFVEVEKTMYMPFDGKVAFELSLDESLNTRPYYKLIIPKEEPKQKNRKVCKCKRAYENPLSEICGLCWNELYPNEKDEIKDENLLEPKQETLEEAAKEFVLSHDFSLLTNPNHLANRCFQLGAKWQAEQDKNKFSEEDMFEFSQWISHEDWVYLQSKGYWVNEEQEELEQKLSSKEILNMWFEQSKNK